MLEEGVNMKKRVAIITGGGSGIGREICIQLSERGYDIAIFDVVDKEDVEDTIEQIEKNNTKVKFMKVDVSNESQVQNCVSDVVKTMGIPEVLVNNAGIFPRSHTKDIVIEDWENVININLGGTFICSKHTSKYMLDNGGVIINLSSKSGIKGERMGAHYAASKAGIIALTRSFALEWSPKIRVNTIIPGLTDTNQPREVMSTEDLVSAGNKIPLKRIAQPIDIANAVCFLVSSQASYITGQTLSVNGGSLML